MPKRDKTGPPKGSKGPRDGSGGGKGRATGKGTGAQTGGKKGIKKIQLTCVLARTQIENLPTGTFYNTLKKGEKL